MTRSTELWRFSTFLYFLLVKFITSCSLVRTSADKVKLCGLQSDVVGLNSGRAPTSEQSLTLVRFKWHVLLLVALVMGIRRSEGEEGVE